MNYFIASIILIFFIGQILFQSSEAIETEFQINGPRISGTPKVCTIEPDINQVEYLTENHVERILHDSKNAIQEWEVHLKNKAIYEKLKANWEINYELVSLEEQDEFDYNKCTIFLTFLPKPEDQNKWFSYIGESQYEAGNTGRTTIVIYYERIEFCRSQDAKFYYYNPCYVGKPRTPQQILTTVKHEFGHALGLGHYMSEDNEINLKWARGGFPSPSIMTIFTHQNTRENKISTIDIDMVYSLYGEDGFLQNISRPFMGFESFSTSNDQYFKEKDETSFVTIVGNVTRDLIREGNMLELMVTKPDYTQEEFTARINSTGGFEAFYPIDEETIEGIYNIQANYIGYNSEEISFEVLTKIGELVQSSQNVQKIPTWIKNNARWWAEDRIEDNDFVEGIRYLIEQNIIKINPVETTGTGEGRIIPDWIKIATGWWANDLVPEDDFIRGMQYLIQEGIISFN